MTRFILCAMFGALLLSLAACNGGSSEWTVYDVEYVEAQTYDVTTCVIVEQQLQSNAGHDWFDWWKHWKKYRCKKYRKHHKHDCEGQPEPEPEPEPEPVCETELYDLPAYFILRHWGLETLYVNAADLLEYRDGMTVEDAMVAMHYIDLAAEGLRFYPDFLFDIDGNIMPEEYLAWTNQ